MNYIELAFQNAALCLDKPDGNGKVHDYVHDSAIALTGQKNNRWLNRGLYDAKHERNSFLHLEDKNLFSQNPIRMESVSNMLHILCGFRPVSTIKENYYKKRNRLEEIDNIAKNVWIKIDNIYYTERKDGEKVPVSEFTQGKKFVHNADRQDLSSPLDNNKFVKGSYITWDSLYKRYYFFDNDKYNRIINQLKTWYGNEDLQDKYTLCGLLLYLANERGLKQVMATFFKKEKLMPLVRLIEGKSKITSINTTGDGNNNNYNLARLPVNTTPCSKLYLNGTIIVPIENNTIFNMIANGVRNCTFLEGGKVSIKYATDFFDLNWLELNGYEQIFQEKFNVSN